MATVTPLTNLREEEQIMATLLELLKQEQQLLVTAEIDGLPAVTAKKTALIAQMTLLSAQRHRALGKAGFPAEEAGMEAWIAAGADQHIAQSWKLLLEHTREAKELNRVNGMLINKQMTHTQSMLNAMRTPAGGSDAGVYGPRGQASVGGPSRRFVVG
jgi:flagella synthesis protein FlgN